MKRKYSINNQLFNNITWRLIMFILLGAGIFIPAYGQDNIKISGQVLDAGNDETLIGVTIQVVGTNNGTITDVNGNFTLYNIESSDAKIKFSYVGYKAVEVDIPQSKVINIKLEEDKMNMEEVVVVGYGSQKRESVIGAIATMKPKILTQNTTRSMTNGLAGQITGVIAVQKSGEPGSDAADFWIRGINTFGTNATPLVLVDGIERNLADINSEEVESFSILKDASATAVYGVRGANGVILIKTKKGKIGRPVITFKANHGISNPTQLPEFVNGAKYMEVMNDAMTLSGLAPTYTQEDIDITRNGSDPDLYPDVDWLNELTTSNVPQSQYSVDINGGTERLRYSLILGYFDEEGIYATAPNVGYNSAISLNRVNVRSNVDVNLTPSTLMTVSIGGYRNQKNSPATSTDDIMDAIFKATPILHPTVYSNGQIPKYGDRRNPYALVTQTGYAKTQSYTVQTLLSVNQDMGAIWSGLEGLNVKFTYSFDNYNWNSLTRSKSPSYYWASSRDENGNLLTSLISEGSEFLGYGRNSGGNNNQYLEAQANYHKLINDKHTIDALLLFNRREYVNSEAANAIMAIPYRNQGLAGRIGYDYASRYFAEFNFGYNGSENFKKGQRYGFFPSAAIGWLASGEKFMQGISNTISKLKIRGSLGLVGNDQISDTRRFGYIATVNEIGGYNLGYTAQYYKNGYQEGDAAVDNLTWEESLKANIGIELGLFNDINMQVDLFKEWRSDIFMQRKTIPETAGYTQLPYANFGKVENKGFEVSVDYNKAINKDWFVSARANYSYAHNTITEFDEPAALKNTTLAQTGHPINQHFGLIATGLYTNDDFASIDEENNEYILSESLPEVGYGIVRPGDIKYQDLNNDGTIDDNDKTAIGKPWVPEVIYGFGASIRYKSVDFGFFFQGAANMTNMLTGSYLIPGSGGGGVGNIYDNVDDRWTPESANQDVFWPRLSATESSNNSQASTWWLKDSKYLRLKNLELGYTIPKKWRDKAFISNARIYYRGTNLLTFAAFDLWDPELGSSNGFAYPTSKTHTIGVELTF
ncbi:SusC/RagA family TonB-linked outer membrane protein [Plebeiibacterium marinum]|uniref:TonB-dependent receptor n=1 Tax=Plebeiibacterium marinum TaxID=2992111 RepID=A0AAE3SI99_9BACT|nr:TonB-dependent receptor [Plebeiobacterium marinum]MCW3804500.1 TonB-dependent receptor [Plebeiobacterium marinum]